MTSATDTQTPGVRTGKDEALLKEIRERWTYASDQWREIREEAQKDMRYVAGDPWDPADRKAREEAGRPCLSLDELGQYVNQVINDVRQNPRAVRVTAMGDGATDETANFRANLIRQIEYRSNAQQAYTTTFENAVQRSYGYHRVTARYVSDRGFDQELVIEPIANPDDVTPDPDAVRTDGSDWRYCFIREQRTHAEFKREFPKAEIVSFDAELCASAPEWVTESRIFLAEYWTKEITRRELLRLKVTDAQGPREITAFADELPASPDPQSVVKRRVVDAAKVVQYLTNGVEILKRTEWPGKYLPIVPCYGKVLYLDEGRGSTRKILSMIRLARDPQMLYCYYRTCEAELVGMTPKTPFVGVAGQFRGHEAKWQAVNHTPQAYLEYEAQTERTGTNLLPAPQRQPYDPPIQALELGAESARRAIQSAMGTSPLPTEAQRRNEKSGVALQRMETSAQKGSFHFIDHYDEAIQRTGAILNDLVPFYYDTARDVTVRKPDDTPSVVRINDPAAPEKKTGKPVLATVGDHDVTISTGPSFDSEREAASDFADLLVQNPQVFPLIAPLAVKLKNLGPIGDQMADLLKLLMPPEARAILDEGDGEQPDPLALQQQLAEAGKMLEALKGELDAKTRAIETDQAKAQANVQIETIRQQEESARLIAKLEADTARENAKLQIEAAKLQVEQARLELEKRKLEVELEIELAKLGSAQAMARAEIEQQELHQHDQATLEREKLAQAAAQRDLDRQAERERAEASAQQQETTE